MHEADKKTQLSLILQKKQSEKIPEQDRQFDFSLIKSSIKTNKMVRVQRIQVEQKNSILKRITKPPFKKSRKSNQELSKQETQILTCSQFMKNPDPYIVAIQKVWKTKQYYNIKMQWCNNGSLEDQLVSDKLVNQRPQLCILYFLSILYSITACNQRGIHLHRDIKPENILINQKLESTCIEKQIKLCDFGISSFQKSSKSFQGTLLYLAPQIYAIEHDFEHEYVTNQFKRQNYTGNCDMFSLGIICYQLNNGLHPKKRTLEFPFIQNIIQRMNQQDADEYQLAKQYYKAAVDIEKSLTSLRVWNNISAKNKQRMKIFRDMIRKMLQPYPSKRLQIYDLYEWIKNNRQILFADLEQTQIVRHFNIYYQKSMKYKQRDKNTLSLAQTQLVI